MAAVAAIQSDRLKEETRRIRESKSDAYSLGAGAWRIVSDPGADEADRVVALWKAEYAARLAPDNPDIINTLGVTLYRVGKYEDCLDALRCSTSLYAELGAKQPADLAFMAMSQWKLGGSG